MSDKRHRWGQFYTAPEVVDLVLGFCLRRPGDRLLDPSCGQGAFLSRAAHFRRWLANSGGGASEEGLWGVEIDPEAAAAAGLSLAADGVASRILVQDFFSLQPGEELSDGFDAVVGNPPYTRSEWLGRVGEGADYKERLVRCAEPLARLGRRSGLHAYFFVHGSRFLRPQGRFGFVVSNSWLDVDYGIGLKQFLLDHFKILVIVESAVERWFSQAKVNTCLVILEKCPDATDRMRNQVRFARLRQPLHELLVSSPDSPGRAADVESLIMRLLPGRSRLSGDLPVRVVPQATLRAEGKWGLYLRAPEVFFQTRARPGTVRLGEIAQVRRGQTTGANSFFYLSEQMRQKWGIEGEFVWPLLKSPKEVETIQVESEGLPQHALVVAKGRDELAGTNVLRYIQWGESQNYHRRATCARRALWYSLAPEVEAQDRVVWVKGIWNRHFAPLVEGGVVADQQFYTLSVDSRLVRVLAALLNSTWAALQAELLGRSNFGEGVLWLAGYEVARIQLPDPSELGPDDFHSLEDALAPLLDTPVQPVADQVRRPAQQRLDSVVFEMLGLTPGEGEAVLAAAVERTALRMSRAEAGRGG
jgi:methylase of polypeptide subunit release factors